jgi:hypothetical protein
VTQEIEQAVEGMLKKGRFPTQEIVMEIPSQHLELVRDALYARDMRHVGCFAFNKASERVQEVGLPILPALEHVLREEVMPSCPLDPTAQHEAFPGVRNLVVDYLQIVMTEGQRERAATFVSSLSGAVLVEAIRYISIEWDHVIPQPFMKMVETAAQCGLPEEREIAIWALNWHRNKPQIEEGLAAARKGMGL